MINKYLGETIEFSIVVKDEDGTAITTASPVISVKDFQGTIQETGTGTHSSSGSYYHSVSTGTIWNSGPINYTWQIYSDNGTGITTSTNEINLISGTSEPDSYIYLNELSAYFGRINDYIDDNSQDKLVSSYNYINRLLESLDISVPRAKNADGFYDQSLRSMNAWLSIYNIVQDYEVNRVPTDSDPWYKKFYDNFNIIYEDIKKKKIVFRDQVSAAESGIQKPERLAGSSYGTMYNNWDRSYGKGFQGADFPRKWVVEIIGTGTAGEVNECTYKWTNNDWIGSNTGTTNYDWSELAEQVFVRFDRGSYSAGTTGIFNIGDSWQFVTNPKAMQKGGLNGAKSYQ